MKQVLRWRRLELAGFGVWKGTTRFHFPDGLGVFCLPNERGKSTMVAGLQAVIFGLPGETDPGGSGIGRYRSWSRPEVCRGRLDIEIGGRIIRIRREMVTHRTIVDEIDSDDRSRKPIFEGEANPGARAAGRQSYRGFLEEVLGPLADQKLFASTFVIEQPVLPATEIGESTRQLVGGVGRVGGQSAQKKLFEVVKSLTKATGDRGIFSPESQRATNQRTDGRIEEIEAALRSLEAKLEGAAEQFDRKETLEDGLVGAIERAKKIREGEKHAKADIERIEAYRKDRIEADSARQAYDDLKRVLDEHEKQIARAHSVRQRAAALYGDLAGAPDDLEARIERVLQLEETRRTLIEAACGPYLSPEKILTEDEQRARLLTERDSISEAVLRLDRWSRIPVAEGQSRPEPIVWLAKVRAAGDRFQSVVGRFLDADGQHREARSQRERFASIAVLPEEAQEELTRLDAAREERARAEKMASTFRNEVASRRKEFEGRYESLHGFDLPRFLSTLDGRAAQHRRLRELSEDAKTARAILSSMPAGRRWGRGLLIGIPAGAIAAVSILLLLQEPVYAAAAFALLAGSALLAFTSPSARVREARMRIRANERETGDIRERLRGEFIPSGPWLPDDEFAFERARSLVANREADAAAIERSERAILSAEGVSTGLEIPAIPGPEIEETEFDIEEHTPGSIAARISAIDRIEQKAKEIAEECGMPAADAVREYRKLSARLHALDGQRREALAAMIGAENEAARSTAALGEGGPAYDPRLGLSGTAAGPARPEFRNAAPAGGTDDPMAMPIASLPYEWKLLAEAVETLGLKARTLRDLHDDLASAPRKRWTEWEAEAAAYCAARDQSAKIEESLDAIASAERALEEARAGAGDARLQASEGSARKLRERLRQENTLEGEAANAERAALDILRTARGGPFEDPAALQAAHSLADEGRRDAQSRIDRAGEASDLVLRFGAEQASEQDRIRRETAEKADGLATALQQVERDLAQAQAELKAWQSGSSVNLAQHEIEIAQRREELEILRERADAATQAWHLLGESIQEFRSTHQVRLAERLDLLFRRITHRDGRKIELDPRLEIEILEDGHASREGQLSQGARDQLAFCLRLAVAELVAGEIVLPLILDDPFVHSDAERLDRIGGAIMEASRDRQILLLTQDERLAKWGEPVRMEAF